MYMAATDSAYVCNSMLECSYVAVGDLYEGPMPISEWLSPLYPLPTTLWAAIYAYVNIYICVYT